MGQSSSVEYLRGGNASDNVLVDILTALGGTTAFDVGQSFEQKVTQGLVEGYSWNDKFGVNDVITIDSDPEDVIEIGGIYPVDAFGTAPVVSIASTSASDVGVQVKCQLGLDINGDEVDDTYTLNGTTRVALTTPLWKALSFEVIGTQAPVGDIFIYTGTGTVPSLGDPEVRNYINSDDKRTNLMYTTIPAGKVGFLYSGEFNMELTSSGRTSTEFARCRYQSSRVVNGVQQLFSTKKVITIVSTASSNYIDRRDFPDPIPALTSVKLNVKTVSDTMGIGGAAVYLIVDEDKLPTAYLQAIGQPGY